MTEQPSNLSAPRKPGRFILWLLVAMLACMAWFFFALLLRSLNPLVPRPHPFQPPEMAAVQYAKTDMVGNLGGIPVTIPQHFANYVEYEGDPGWGEKRKGPMPERTHASRLNSFGFKVRLPDMAGLSSREMWKDRNSYTIYNTPWIRVRLTSGNFYFGDGFLDRQASYLERWKVDGNGLAWERYEPINEPFHGLTVYVPTGTDPKTQRPYREGLHAEDVFLHRTADGKVDAYIRCSNRPHEAAPCTQAFSMEPGMEAAVDVSYRRGLLPQWRQIQTDVSRLIWSFKAAEGSSSTRQ
ncbi:hypothetical protein [Noviherbaspirillum soli]|uniref:hypothetical protein n=1 Tax=Noviherbaspirillum soli TaxID=1064518 RepID=UPI00188A3329|nr:hypothetical protein [Noviherbaspirillum soli]